MDYTCTQLLVMMAESKTINSPFLNKIITEMKNYLITPILFIFSTLSAYPQTHYCEPLSSLPCEHVSHTYFNLCYGENDEQAVWVSYMLTRIMVETNNCQRTDNFKADAAVSTGSATPADYKSSGFDRGHLCPAADMNFNCTAMKESFLMSNMSPQTPSFNRGIWSRLEDLMRQWAVLYDTIYIATAGILNQPCLGHIGANNVSIPAAYYKYIYRNTAKGSTCIAFVLPNEGSQQALFEFVIPTDSLEALSGIDFMPCLPSEEQDDIERSKNLNMWEFK